MMQFKLAFVVAVIVVALATTSAFAAIYRKVDVILLRDVDTLVFRDGEYAHRSRSPSVPAMSCVGRGTRVDALPGTVTCRNTGWDGTDVTWQCSAELPTGVTLRNADVICEGYSSPEDPYIRAGSCSLEYTLDDRRSHPQRHYEPPTVPSYVRRQSWVHYGPEKGYAVTWSLVVATCCVITLSVASIIACVRCNPAFSTTRSPVAAPVASDYDFRRRRRRGDVDLGAPAHVFHHHDDTDCTGARRVDHRHHHHHDSSPTHAVHVYGPDPAPAASGGWSFGDGFSSTTDTGSTTTDTGSTHTSSVGAQTHRSSDSSASAPAWISRSDSDGKKSTHMSSTGARTRRV